MSEINWSHEKSGEKACCINCFYFHPVGMLTESTWGFCEKDDTRSVIKRERHYCFLYKGRGITPEEEINSLKSRIEGLEGNCERFLKTIRRLKEALDQKLSARKLLWKSIPDFHGSKNFICNTSIGENCTISIYRDTSGLSLSSLRDNEPTEYAFVAYFETIDDQVIQIACEDTVYDTQVAVQRWLDDLAKSIQRKDME